GTDGDDPRVQAYAKELAKAYVADPSRVDPSLASAALSVAAAHGDRALFDALRKRFATTTVPGERSRILAALGRFRDPALAEEALRFALDPGLRPQEVTLIPRFANDDPATRERAGSWMLAHYDDVARRVPEMMVAFLPLATLRNVCTAERLAEVR